jgi:amino acid adenylation domain-containing protein
MFLLSLFGKINDLAMSSGDDIALLEGDRSVTYSVFRAIINGVVSQLRAAGVRPGDRVGLYLENSIEAYGAIYAVILIGCTYVPLPINDPLVRLSHILSDAELKIIITVLNRKKALDAALSLGADVNVIEINNNTHTSQYALLDTKGLSETTPAYILYTSGSTGTPKGVPIAASCIGNFIRWADQELGLSASDCFLGHTRLTFDLSVFDLFGPMFCGGSVRIVKDGIDQMYPGSLLAKDITIALIVPRVTGHLLNAEQLKQNSFKSLRHLLFCGEKLLASQVNAWIRTHPETTLHNIYGPTEATVACTHFMIPKGVLLTDPVPIGEALPGMTMHIEFSDEKESQQGGELWIAGTQVSPFGYWNKPSENFLDHPVLGRVFKSGDRVKRDEKQNLVWLSRIDDQVKIRGFRVELGEIEAVLSDHSAVHDLVCHFDPEPEEIIVVMKLAKGSSQVDVIKELMEKSEMELASYMRPGLFIVVKELPRTSSGKVNRKELSLIVGQKRSQIKRDAVGS